MRKQATRLRSSPARYDRRSKRRTRVRLIILGSAFVVPVASLLEHLHLIIFAVTSPPTARRPIPANAPPRSHSFPPSPPNRLVLIGFKETCRPPSSRSGCCSVAPLKYWVKPAANPATIIPVWIDLQIRTIVLLDF